ncbi:MAG: ubiquinol-cytochrome c reductase iron-sulfur subunit [Bacteroidia bacterium]
MAIKEGEQRFSDKAIPLVITSTVHKMERKEFLALVGTSIAAITIGSCISGCQKQSSTPAAATVNFNLNLSDPANSALASPGGYLYSQGVIIARTQAGAYLAVSQACTHAGASVVYQSSQNAFYCPSHGSSFNSSGAVTGGPAGSPLKVYNTQLSGTTLHVWG